MNTRGKGYTLELQIDREDMIEYGEYFREMRMSIGLTQVEMGLEIGASKHSVYRWENGLKIPKMDIDELVDKYKQVVKKYKAG